MAGLAFHPGDAHGFYFTPQVWIDGSKPAGALKPDTPGRDDEVLRVPLACGLECLVFRDGLFMFGFDGSPFVPPASDKKSGQPKVVDYERIIRSQVLILNAFVACLHSALITGPMPYDQSPLAVTPMTMVSSTDLNSDQFTSGDALVRGMVSCQPRRSVSGWGSGPVVQDFWAPIFEATPLSVVHAALGLFDTLVGDVAWASRAQLAELLLRSMEGFVEGDNVSSLLSSWAVTESLLSKVWDDYIESQRKRDGRTFINSKRKKHLESESTDADAIIESLSLLDLLPFELYEQISQARRARNKWIHGLEDPSYVDADVSFSAAIQLFRSVHGVPLALFALQP